MPTPQPKWRFLANLGDKHPLDYGGYLIFQDETGQYTEEAEYWNEPEEGKTSIDVYRFSLDCCTFVNGVLSDNPFHPEIEAWFSKHVEGMAHSFGLSVDTLRGWFCSGVPQDRAHAYRCIGDYPGWNNLDDYPLHLTRVEAEARYKDIPENQL